MKHKTVTKARDAVRLMGGPTAVGRWWGIGHSGVCDMVRRDRISGPHHLQTYFYLTHMGHKISPKLFGLATWKELFPPNARGEKTNGRAHPAR